MEGLIRRGHFVKVAIQGDYGKPRPALIIQSDLFIGIPSVAFCPLTTDRRGDAGELRLDVRPTAANGLREPSQIMIDKISVIPRAKIGAIIGEADDQTMLRVTRALAVFLGMV